MVVGAFPVAKLGALLLKQISKPIANTIKEQAKNSPFFRTYVCMPPAQFYNWCEVKAKMWILNLGRPVNIPVLNEAMAIELGANLLGEGVIFVIAAAILINEYNRSSRKEEAKENAKREEMEKLQNTIRDLFFKTEQQAFEVREIRTYLYDLESKVVFKPGTKPPPPPPPPPSPPQGDVVEKEKTQLGDVIEQDEKKASEVPSSPPTPSEPPSTQPLPDSEKKTNDDTATKTNDRPQGQEESRSVKTSLLLKAITFVENELWRDESRHIDTGIINLALDQLDMYRFQSKA